ncbi:cysteine--tRNA ligase [Schleiferilactobacillus harbinensis]|jgi:cysteinyl-tRNA synthetase|uniref:Cysteine--tRNA ligase n=3 Tax=Schleiferilactobacillus harbinensis TaxID=304207 RepID=A0ABU7T0N5_9LACO|nr:cysteine--tRNA ligase [Schleiferilactobacillus harbinensis]HAY53803.1 cysteine--tRNA ligase [Lactobacillus sp.]MCI1688039.1 cysteine--tRNA ligase [Schleiferilactobacillus harbinensis]MCI1782417.1 cysteine--tRNA ligase [Schleiferilactobacillus harbinensis]MCI1852081.1 cysteine--tRNA ligase [Schleiferilactobacillus harbinensis]MCT2907982.1 cysteine--tRNA ligase [Schleiferilactobacillus harbinensis]
MLKVWNTLTNQKEEFHPLTPHIVNMYVCGPTVYNYIHIGNARSAIAFDTIRRYFEFRGYTVNYISNFTDVDDKLINEAKAENSTVPAIADKYIAAFYEDTDALNIERATVNPRASHNIPEIIDFIKILVDKGYAYPVDGDVYYRTRKFKNYGELSGQNVDELEQGASQHVTAEELARKEDPLDFALWKAAKPDEISWESPWGQGRPGWHIECSVMSIKYLGATFDIHGGGQDLEFPHHENEIAQSEAATGHTFARYWLHNGFVTIGDDDEKMSKSLGNFVLARDLIQDNDPQAVRFLMATTQYRRPIRYSQASLQDAKNNLERLQTAWTNLNYRFASAEAGNTSAVDDQADAIQTAFITAMDDDFNAQNGMTHVYELAKTINTYVEQKVVRIGTLEHLRGLLRDLAGIFGIQFAETGELLDADVENLIEERIAARKAKNFARSDEIRDQLAQEGIILEDTPQGTRWHRK